MSCSGAATFRLDPCGGAAVAFDIPILQLVAYSSLTCASVLVASVSAMFGYRQNFGWKPILFHTGLGYDPTLANSKKLYVDIDFEV
jgi:hypothetical protein